MCEHDQNDHRDFWIADFVVRPSEIGYTISLPGILGGGIVWRETIFEVREFCGSAPIHYEE